MSKQKNEVEVTDGSEVEIPSADDTPVIRMDDFENLGTEKPEIRLMYGVQIPSSAR